MNVNLQASHPRMLQDSSTYSNSVIAIAIGTILALGCLIVGAMGHYNLVPLNSTVSMGLFAGGLAVTALMTNLVCVKLLQSDRPIKTTSSRPDPEKHDSAVLTQTTNHHPVARRKQKQPHAQNEQLLQRMCDFYNKTAGSIPTRDQKEDPSRTLANILQWSDDQLEEGHDYIQWLFTTTEPSGPNPYSPTFVSEQTVQQVRSDPTIQANYKCAFARIIRFYGFHYDQATRSLQDITNVQGRIQQWTAPDILGRDNHNFLRLSRILKSLEIYNLQDERAALWTKLQEIKNGNYDVPLTWWQKWFSQRKPPSQLIQSSYPIWEKAAQYKWRAPRP